MRSYKTAFSTMSSAQNSCVMGADLLVLICRHCHFSQNYYRGKDGCNVMPEATKVGADD